MMPQALAHHSREEGTRQRTTLRAGTPEHVTLDEAAAAYLDWLARTPDVRGTTKAAYATDLTQFVAAITDLGPVPLAEVDERHVEAWKSGMTT